MPTWNGLRPRVNGTRGMCLRSPQTCRCRPKAPGAEIFGKHSEHQAGEKDRKGKQGDQATGQASPRRHGKTIKFHEFPEQTQKKLVQESPEVLKRIFLAVEGFSAPSKLRLCLDTPKTRTLISGLSDEAGLSLLNQGLDESLLTATLNEQNLKASDPSNVPTTVKPARNRQATLALGEKLMNSGNSFVMDELKSQSNGAFE